MLQIFHFVPIAHSWVNRAEKGSGMHSVSLLASRELCLIFVTIFSRSYPHPAKKPFQEQCKSIHSGSIFYIWCEFARFYGTNSISLSIIPLCELL